MIYLAAPTIWDALARCGAREASISGSSDTSSDAAGPQVAAVDQAPSSRQEHHLRAAEQRHQPARGLVGHNRIPDVRLAAQVQRYAAAGNALAAAGRGHEIRLELERRERRALRDVVSAADGGAGVGKRDHRRREEKARAGDKVLGHVDVTGDELERRVVENAPELTRDERSEELGRAARSRNGIHLFQLGHPKIPSTRTYVASRAAGQG